MILFSSVLFCLGHFNALFSSYLSSFMLCLKISASSCITSNHKCDSSLHSFALEGEIFLLKHRYIKKEGVFFFFFSGDEESKVKNK